mmetsp:Transcript_96657/g.273740  ORF Transcript_96657/g.273740 Transcript_96657/m.273740 type:complete len:282 (+) Transcript_96657:701-1546(+)
MAPRASLSSVFSCRRRTKSSYSAHQLSNMRRCTGRASGHSVLRTSKNEILHQGRERLMITTSMPRCTLSSPSAGMCMSVTSAWWFFTSMSTICPSLYLPSSSFLHSSLKKARASVTSARFSRVWSATGWSSGTCTVAVWERLKPSRDFSYSSCISAACRVAQKRLIMNWKGKLSGSLSIASPMVKSWSLLYETTCWLERCFARPEGDSSAAPAATTVCRCLRACFSISFMSPWLSHSSLIRLAALVEMCLYSQRAISKHFAFVSTHSRGTANATLTPWYTE